MSWPRSKLAQIAVVQPVCDVRPSDSEKRMRALAVAALTQQLKTEITLLRVKQVLLARDMENNRRLATRGP